jgi:hypothetical protein
MQNITERFVMKRSKMVELMALTIAKQAINSGNHDIDISWINVDALLSEIEKARMSPPFVDQYESDTSLDIVGNRWEE